MPTVLITVVLAVVVAFVIGVAIGASKERPTADELPAIVLRDGAEYMRQWHGRSTTEREVKVNLRVALIAKGHEPHKIERVVEYLLR